MTRCRPESLAPMIFEGVRLDECIVLGWTLTDDLEISLDIALDSSHALYEPPIPGERAYFKPGILKFPNASAVQGSSLARRGDTVWS